MPSTVRLAGTVNKPVLMLSFDPQQPHPAAPERTLLDWVQNYITGTCGGRGYFQSRTREWAITATGPDPSRKLHLAGFTIDYSASAPELAHVLDVNELATPISRISADGRRLMVLPRLTGFDWTRKLLGDGAIWNREFGRFEAPVAEAIHKGVPRPGIEWDHRILDAAIAARGRILIRDEIRDAAAAAGALKDPKEMNADELAALIELVGDVPDWFGLDLYPFQRLGAIAVASGHFGLFDEPGLGKTRQFIAAAAILKSRRTLITSLPVALTNWAKEVEQSGLHTLGGAVPDGDIVVFRSGRKEPALPDSGVVVVADSLIAARPALQARLAAWEPDTIGFDEAHRGKTFTSARSQAMISLAGATKRAPVAITGTPMFANPAEIAPMLAFTGHLSPVFGGVAEYLERYCIKDNFGRWRPRLGHLDELRMKLEQNVWVRRRKRDVLPDLPQSQITGKWVDVSLTDYRAAHRDIVEQVKLWLAHVRKETKEDPTPEMVEAYASGQLGMLATLRRAAGMSKISSIVEDVREHVEQTMEMRNGRPYFPRPLIVWTHHKDVSAAMAAAVPETVARTGAIVGGVSHSERDELVAAFQRNEIPVLVCSLAAAGVAITLTASSDMFFAESDYTPAVIRQALDRAERIGQTSDRILATVYLAAGTIDGNIQKILLRKSKTLDKVYGSGNDVSAISDGDDVDSAVEVLSGIVWDVVRSQKKR